MLKFKKHLLPEVFQFYVDFFTRFLFTDQPRRTFTPVFKIVFEVFK